VRALDAEITGWTLTEHAGLSRETVRRGLHENELKPWQRKMWRIARVDAEYVARMEDVLDLYATEPKPNQPVVSFDESPVQLIGEVREPIAAVPGQAQHYDSEYHRNGTANLFVMVDAHRPWRHVKVTDQRTGQDFAACMRDLVDQHYPRAQRIRIVWLNMMEIEIGVRCTMCLDRRIEQRSVLESEMATWERRRNVSKEKIKWMFHCEKARKKMRHAYPQINSRTNAIPVAA